MRGESESMQTIELNAANWKTVLDFYHAVFAAVGAQNGMEKVRMRSIP